jgi:hypothetical protein
MEGGFFMPPLRTPRGGSVKRASATTMDWVAGGIRKNFLTETKKHAN